MLGTDTTTVPVKQYRLATETCAAWTGVVVFVFGTESFAEWYAWKGWSNLGRGFVLEYDQAGLVFTEFADEDLMLVARAEKYDSIG